MHKNDEGFVIIANDDIMDDPESFMVLDDFPFLLFIRKIGIDFSRTHPELQAGMKRNCQPSQHEQAINPFFLPAACHGNYSRRRIFLYSD